MKAVKKIEISVLHKRITPIVYAVQGDTGREIECTVVDWDIPAGVAARVWVVKPSKKVVYNDCRIVDKAVFVPMTNQTLAEPGGAICMIEFVSGEDVVSSFSFNLYVYESASGDGIPSENESTVLEGMFEELAQDAIKTLNEAKAQAAAAKKSAQDTEKIKNDFTLTAQQAVADVNNAGQTQTQRVNTAGDTQVSRIQAEGTTQVQNVQATAAEIAADREQIHTNRDNTARLQRTTAGAIMRRAEGSFVTLEDAADEMGFRRIEIEGETRQVTTTGAQMIDFEQCLKNWKSQYTQVGGRVYKITAIGTGYQAPVAFSENDIKVTLSGIIGDLSGSGYRIDLIDSSGNIVGRINKDIKSITGLASKIRLNFAEAGAGEYSDIMLNAGSAVIPWEPYTGSKPSPSPEYPQELENVGRMNKDGEYEVKVHSSGAQLLKLSDVANATRNGMTYSIHNSVVTVNGTPSAAYASIVSGQLTLLPGTYYVAGGETSPGHVGLQINVTKANGEVDFCRNQAFTIDGTERNIAFAIQCSSDLSPINNYTLYPMLNAGDTPLPCVPYRASTATITSDRPLTKWDKLTCRDGVWGWAYGGITVVLDGTEQWTKWAYTSSEGLFVAYTHVGNINPSKHKIMTSHFVCDALVGANEGVYESNRMLHFTMKTSIASSVDELKTWLANHHVTAEYQLAEEEWVPLSAEEQAAMNALCTYAGTTHIWTDDPLQPVISLDYTVDTETYIKDTTPAYRDVEKFALTGEASGAVATCMDSADWPLLGIGMLGKCEQLTTTGANLFGGRALADKIMEVAPDSIIDEDKGTITFASNIISGKTLYDNFDAGKRYTIILCGKNTDQSYTATNIRLTYDDGINVSLSFQTANAYSYCVYSSTVGKTVVSMSGIWITSKTELQYDKCGIFEGAIDLSAFEPYTGAAPSPSPAYKQEIQETGTYNPETGMYEADMAMAGAQLFDVKRVVNGSYDASTGVLKQVGTNNTIGSGVKVLCRKNGEFIKAIYMSRDIGNHTYTFIKNDTFDEIGVGFNGDKNDTLAFCNLTRDGNYTISLNFVSNSLNSGVISNIMLNAGTTALPWEPYKEMQSLTLTADQPWRGIGDVHDEVCDRDGVLGTWRRFAVVDNGKWETCGIASGTVGKRFRIALTDIKKPIFSQVVSSHFVQKTVSSYGVNGTYIATSEIGYIHIRVEDDFPATTTEEFRAWAQENGLYTIYLLETPVWEPFPEEIQRAYRKLKSYAGTTHAWVDDPLQPEVSFKYVKDSKAVIKNLQLDIAEQITDLQAQIDQLTINNNL